MDVDTGDDSASCVGLLPIVPSITHSVAPTANVTLRIDAVSGAPILAVVALDDLAPGACVVKDNRSFSVPVCWIWSNCLQEPWFHLDCRLMDWYRTHI